MELVREFFLTASLALLLSFLVAKLVAFALASDSGDRDSGLKPTSVSDEGIAEAEKPYGDCLMVRGSEIESRSEFVRDAVEEVDYFQRKPDHHHHHHHVEEIAEQVQHRQEEVSGEQSGTETAPAKKVCDFAPRSGGVNEEGRADDSLEETFGNRGVDVIGEESAADEDVPATGDESKAKDELNEVGMHDESEDDDWEGIERSELEVDFAAAVKYVESHSGARGDDRVMNAGSDVQMELFGLHKVAMEGPCYDSPPIPLNLSARAKWNAWQRFGNMSPDMAMEQYITVLSDNVPGWMEDHLAGEHKLESSKGEITIDPGARTYVQDQPDFAYESEPELKSSVDGGGITDASHLENSVAGQEAV